MAFIFQHAKLMRPPATHLPPLTPCSFTPTQIHTHRPYKYVSFPPGDPFRPPSPPSPTIAQRRMAWPPPLPFFSMSFHSSRNMPSTCFRSVCCSICAIISGDYMRRSSQATQARHHGSAPSFAKLLGPLPWPLPSFFNLGPCLREAFPPPLAWPLSPTPGP